MRDHKPISLESHLANLPLLSGIAADALKHITRSSKIVSAPKGDVLFRAGDACSGFHLLVYGQVKLAFTSTQGTEKIVEIVQHVNGDLKLTQFSTWQRFKTDTPRIPTCAA